MARIRRWKEKLLLVWFTVFTSLVWARPRSRMPESRIGATRSLIVKGSGGKRAWGVALSTSRPYVQAFSASAVPVALPAAVGAFAASAGAMADLAGAAAASASCVTTTSTTCQSSIAPPCSRTFASCCNPWPSTLSCYTIVTCSGSSFYGGGGYSTFCQTCGYGTCGFTC